MAQSPKTIQGGVSLSNKVRSPSMKDSESYTVSACSLTIEVVAHCPRKRQSDHIIMPSSKHRFNETAEKSKTLNRKNVSVRHPPSKSPVAVLPLIYKTQR